MAVVIATGPTSRAQANPILWLLRLGATEEAAAALSMAGRAALSAEARGAAASAMAGRSLMGEGAKVSATLGYSSIARFVRTPGNRYYIVTRQEKYHAALTISGSLPVILVPGGAEASSEVPGWIINGARASCPSGIAQVHYQGLISGREQIRIEYCF
jgi:hypothetical protein